MPLPRYGITGKEIQAVKKAFEELLADIDDFGGELTGKRLDRFIEDVQEELYAKTPDIIASCLVDMIPEGKGAGSQHLSIPSPEPETTVEY